jgi:hypothetical protein
MVVHSLRQIEEFGVTGDHRPTRVDAAPARVSDERAQQLDDPAPPFAVELTVQITRPCRSPAALSISASSSW